MKFKTTYNQYIPVSTTKTLRTGAGEVHAIIITSAAASAELVLFYDNTAGSGNLLLSLYAWNVNPIVIFFPPTMPLKFSTGLTVLTPANSTAFVIVAY